MLLFDIGRRPRSGYKREQYDSGLRMVKQALSGEPVSGERKNKPSYNYTPAVLCARGIQPWRVVVGATRGPNGVDAKTTAASVEPHHRGKGCH